MVVTVSVNPPPPLTVTVMPPSKSGRTSVKFQVMGSAAPIATMFVVPGVG